MLDGGWGVLGEQLESRTKWMRADRTQQSINSVVRATPSLTSSSKTSIETLPNRELLSDRLENCLFMSAETWFLLSFKKLFLLALRIVKRDDGSVLVRREGFRYSNNDHSPPDMPCG